MDRLFWVALMTALMCSLMLSCQKTSSEEQSEKTEITADAQKNEQFTVETPKIRKTYSSDENNAFLMAFFDQLEAIIRDNPGQCETKGNALNKCLQENSERFLIAMNDPIFQKEPPSLSEEEMQKLNQITMHFDSVLGKESLLMKECKDEPSVKTFLADFLRLLMGASKTGDGK